MDGGHVTHDLSFCPCPCSRELMGSLELGGPRDTLEPKAMREQEDSMGPQDPLASR